MILYIIQLLNFIQKYIFEHRNILATWFASQPDQQDNIFLEIKILPFVTTPCKVQFYYFN